MNPTTVTHLRLSLDAGRSKTRIMADGRPVQSIVISVPETEREEVGKALKYWIENLGQGRIVLASPSSVFPEGI